MALTCCVGLYPCECCVSIGVHAVFQTEDLHTPPPVSTYELAMVRQGSPSWEGGGVNQKA